ncbi:hypothetical protein K502DRAFT_133700 [Neoconidiobolus thromboides FSU 785]|nr:hypothetical protein K502DRAFT_133700 [Neoconidiobolus thromboides FSU 785]
MPPNLPPRPETRNNNSYSTNETEIEINFNELLSPTNIDMDYFDHLNFNDKSDEEWENENCNYDNINNKNSMEKVKILDIEPFELVEDYFSTIQHNLNEMEDNLVCNYSMKLNVKEFNLNIQFFKGSCFDEIDQKECIEIQLNQFKLNYIQFIMGDIQSKFNIEVNEFNILDHFQKDKYQKFISFNKGFKDYIFNLELTSISLNDSNVEYRFSMDLLPLRLFINQNSILFLIQLFENENNSTISNETGRVSEDSMDSNNNNETTKLLNKIYFQYIKINEIQLIIDYQPKSIDLMNFKNGQYYEILNLFSFKEAQLKLLNIELNGIEGIDQLFENILNCWLPNIINHQLPTMIGGLKQIQPIYNLSNGIKDFIQLPLQQFKNEGKVLKGVKLGTYNLLKVTTFEALRFSSTIANSVHQILEGAGAALGAKNTNQQQNEQPNGLKEGFELGLKSFNRNLNNNNLIIGNHNNQELQQHNETNLVSTHALLQATPILLLKPMIGTAHLIALSLTGLKNSIKKK